MSSTLKRTEGRVPAGDVHLGFQSWPGSGPVVVGIHGLASHRRAFTGIGEELSPQAQVIAFDLRGRGEADRPEAGPYGIGVHARDIAAALDALGIDEPVVLAGHSMGGYVAASFAAQFPERTRAVALLDGGLPGARTDLDPDLLLEAVLGDYMTRLRRRWASFEELVADLEASDLYRGQVDDLVRGYFAFGLTDELVTKVYEPAARADWRDILTNEASWTNPAAITQPALLVRALDGLTGKGDQVIADHTRDALAVLVPHLQVVDLDGVNHHTFLTTRAGAARTAAVLRTFLEGLPQA